MKYVILEYTANDITRVFPIIFPESLIHKSVADRMIHCIGWDLNHIPHVKSAGHCDIWNGEWDCERGSESLGIKKSPVLDAGDKFILNMPDALQGMLL